ncbi:DUF726 domain-containing protein [Coprinopsis cinerea okayama7|uniref:DUF726 domain-containing protein n=1 Tax=Coprinopsis cinerea (strain Okayama-7 / 130 / ATCC MYA-4618 / FGSC 9003) TaxID=240176 RepID=D6RKG3_COPC7|nr:DUF726 domain-containing protein [Coprinopsis cinerea okayama7\|eukprot:XP_002911838.1 DUF726 domain-containing protein [Coprinopsis cinerea okayama7\
MSSSPRPTLSPSTSLEKITPPKSLGRDAKRVVFDHLSRQLAAFRNTATLYADMEMGTLEQGESMDPDVQREMEGWRREYKEALNEWVQGFLRKAWVVCYEKDEDDCPILDPYADTSTAETKPSLPSRSDMAQLINAILFIYLTTSQTKQYSALTRAFFSAYGYNDLIDENAITWTLQNPEEAVKQAEARQQALKTSDQVVESVKKSHALESRFMRNVGIGLGTIVDGVLIGMTGGLAAPLVGAGLASVLGFFGLGGTILGLVATGLAGSGVVCGALFGVYGAKSTAEMVERHTREVRDLKIVPVRTKKGEQAKEMERGDRQRGKAGETLAVRLCISGWLNDKDDVVAPWTIFGGDDTYALQWEIEALEELSNALVTLITSHAMKYVKGEIIKRTMLAGLMASLAPLALLKIGEIIDNPWMNAKALAIKTGAVLGELLAKRVFGNRPVTLVGYSLGSLAIYEALLYLATLPPSETMHLVQDVFLFGTPASTEPRQWSQIRRVVAGRVINGYAKDDYVLAVLSRASTASWSIAGLEPVHVKGVENVLCEGVKGHLYWRAMVGRCLEQCDAPGIIPREVEIQDQTALIPGSADRGD